MATSVELAKASSKPDTRTKSYTSVQVIRYEVEALVKKHFSATLGTIPDIVNLVISCIYKESGFSTKANSGSHGALQVRRFMGYSAIAAKFSNPKTTQYEKANMRNSVAGFGLMQATGWYLIEGAGPNGQNELMRMRPDIAGTLIVPPGVDINTKLGPDQMTNQLLAGLIILENKYKVAPNLVANPTTAKKPYVDRVSATFGSFLGSGTDKFNTTPQEYAASIIRGQAYKVANGYSAAIPTGGNNTPTTPTGPPKTPASGNNLGPSGC